MNYKKFVFKPYDYFSVIDVVNGVESTISNNVLFDISIGGSLINFEGALNPSFNFYLFWSHFSPFTTDFQIIIDDPRVLDFSNFDWGFADSPDYNMSLFVTAGSNFFSSVALDDFIYNQTLIVPSSLSSLNGDYYSFNDGLAVLTYPNNRQYFVIRSYLVCDGDSNFSIMYDLIDFEQKTLSIPHKFCIKAI